MANYELKAILTAQDKASATISKVGGAFSTLAKVGIAGAIAGVGALTAGLYSSVKAFEESEKVTAQTNAALLSTKGISGMTAKSIADLANEVMSYSGISDEAVQTGENMLLTFTNIGKDVFPTATKALADMATRMSGGAIPTAELMNTTAIQLGKALNDPIQGVTALRRVGVQMTDQQEKMIKKFVESGQIMEAQKIILQELQVEFGGSAAAIGDTFAGKLAIARERMANLQETIGGALLTAINPLLTQLSTWSAQPDVQKKVQEIATEMGNWITNVAIPWVQVHWPAIRDAIKEVIDKTIEIIKWFREHETVAKVLVAAILVIGFVLMGLLSPIGLVIAAIIGLGAWINGQIQTFYFFKDTVVNVANSIKDIFGGVIDFVAIRWSSGVDRLLGFLRKIKDIYNQISGGLRKVGINIGTIPNFQSGGIMKNDGFAYLHKGEKVTPSASVINNDQGVTVQFYGNINNTANASLDAIGQRIGRQIQLSNQGL